MRIALISLFVCTFLIEDAVAQKNWLKGELSEFYHVFDPTDVYLEKAAPTRKWDAIDSARIATDGTFTIGTQNITEIALYRLKYAGVESVEFVAAPQDILIVDCSTQMLKNGLVHIQGSNENELYGKLKDLHNRFKSVQSKMDSLASTIDPFAPKYNALAAALRENYYNEAIALNNLIALLQADNGQTYVGDVLGGLYLLPLKQNDPEMDTLYDSNVSYQHYHFFDRMNLSDMRIASVPRLYDELEAYFTRHVDASTFEGLKNGADILFGKISSSDMKAAVALWLIDRFNKKNDYEMTEYLFNTYYSSGCETEIEGELTDILARMKAVSAGSIAPDITLNDEGGQTISLKSIVGKKVIVVFFWASWCPHCTDKMVDVKQIYSEYAPKGLEIYAVSLDHTREEWKRYLTRADVKWINVAEGIGPKTETSRSYGVHGTPTYFILDSLHRIRYRTNELEELRSELKRLFS